jgi:hypothetical protein
MTIIEPCAGEGHIARYLMEQNSKFELFCIEIREECSKSLDRLGCEYTIGDWFRIEYENLALDECAIITNPPYSIAREFVEFTLSLNPGYCAFLLRMNMLGSAVWHGFWQKYQPQWLITFPRRPSFEASGKTDASEYGWFVWELDPKHEGMIIL